MDWKEVIRGSGLYVHTYLYKKFGQVNSVAIQIGQGGLALVSPPPAPSEAVISELLSLGELRHLVIPNVGHLSGVDAWRHRFTKARIHAPEIAIPLLPRLGVTCEVEPLSHIETETGLGIIDVPGARMGSTYVHSTKGDQPVAYLDEIIINIKTRPRSLINKLAFLITGTKPRLTVNKVFAKTLCSDPQSVKRRALSLIADDSVVVPAHGDIVFEAESIDRIRDLLLE